MNFLFDLYGTLIDIKTDEEKSELWSGFASMLGDSDGERVRREYLDLCKQFASESENKYVEFDLLRVFEKMLEGRGIDKKKAPEFARSFRILSREKLQIFPCVVEMLTGLKARGAGVYLVSNAQSCFTVDELEKCGLAPLFDGILISSDAGVKKPSREIFGIAFDKFSITADDGFYIGNDLRDDVLGAHGAGLTTVYIETEQSGNYPPDEVVVPNYTFDTHEQMMNTLFQMLDKKQKGA